jgi:tetratricopeptide (TPR) repeat protein
VKRLLILSFSILFVSSCIRKRTELKKDIENKFYDRAFEFNEKKETDSAFLNFNKAKDLFLQRKDSLGAGKCLVQMGIISTDRGDYFGGQELALNALSFFDEKNQDHRVYIKSNYNNMGLATYRLKDYENSIRIYDLAIKFSDDSLHTRIYLNNKANSYRELKNYDEAIKIYNSILKDAYKDKKEYARALTNLSFTKWLQNYNYNAGPELLKALHIREKEDDFWGQNSSYSHLSDYYKIKHPDSSLSYAIKMYNVAKQINSPDDELTALQKMIGLNHPNDIKQYFEKHTQLADSLETSRNMAKNQFALIRYDAEKNKVDFLNAQAENAQKENSILRKNILLGFLIVSLILSYFLYKKRRKRLQQEKELEVKKTELRYVKKVHDRVANKIYNTMMEVENADDIDRKTIADKLESIYNISRDISYESNEIDHRLQFAQQLSQMLNNYSSDSIEIIINGNGQELWLDVEEDIKSEIIILLQELMTNMMKHSQATVVQLLFKRIENQIQIDYIDNGIGVEGKPLYKNGLTNTGNRITEINGTINFDTTVSKGLKIEISFPVI